MPALTGEQLLAGSSLTHEVEIPCDLLKTNGEALSDPHVMLRPLTLSDLQRIGKAARDDENLSAALIVKHSLVEPALKLEEVSQLSAGVARFLVDQINAFSGITTSQDALQEYVQEPLAKACFILAKEFGWTPEEVSGLTIGQILLYVEMARGKGEPT